MIGAEATGPGGPPASLGSNARPGSDTPPAPVTTLRGAGVDVDVRRVLPFVAAVCSAALVVAVVALTVAGLQKNDQIDRLHRNGVVVEATVTGCTGLIGGSGSNLVGYDCRASFTLDGHRYDESFAGDATPTPGSRFRAVAVPGDPALVATVAAVAAEHPSWRVFILPALLFVALVSAILGVLWFRAGRRRPAPGDRGPGERTATGRADRRRAE